MGQIGSVCKQPETEVDNSCHNWRVPSKWKGVQRGTKGRLVCGDLLEKAEAALKVAEKREEAEAKVRIMETQCEELVNLTMQAGKQVPAEDVGRSVGNFEASDAPERDATGTGGRPPGT